jgi:hypothetical protein
MVGILRLLDFFSQALCLLDLLRRLSKSQNTVFCGRIHLFLAQLFPLSERSGNLGIYSVFSFQISICLGLNLMSQFNLENVTHYTKAEDYDKSRKSVSLISLAFAFAIEFLILLKSFYDILCVMGLYRVKLFMDFTEYG